MTGKDVCQWLLNKYDDDVLLEIYKEKDIVCKGFRAGCLSDIKTNRKRLTGNLLHASFKKNLLDWYAKACRIEELDILKLEEKELNELVELAEVKGVAPVLIQLLHKKQEDMAVRLFAEILDTNKELLEIQNKSINQKGEFIQKEVKNNEKKEENENQNNVEKTVTKTNSGKKEAKLEKKIGNLKNQIKLRDEQHKKKMSEMDANQKRMIQMKQVQLNNAYEKIRNQTEDINEYTKKIKEYEKREKAQEKTIQDLQQRIAILEEYKVRQEETTDREKINVLVIGEPFNKEKFKEDGISFTFLNNEELNAHSFKDEYDRYFVLLYELPASYQVHLKLNMGYERLDQAKIDICKNFYEVKMLITQYSRSKVGV